MKVPVDLQYIKIDDSLSNQRHGELHLTGDLLASGEDSLRFVPDFSLEDPSLNIRKPKEEDDLLAAEESKNNCDNSFTRVTPDTLSQETGT